MEAPTPVGEGRTSLQVEGGSTSELFGDPIVQGTARLRYGLRDDLELVTEANLLYFTVGGNSSTAAHQCSPVSSAGYSAGSTSAHGA